MHTLDILRALRAGTIGIDEARRKLASATAPAPSPGTRARGVVVLSVQAPEAVALSDWQVGPPAAGEITIHVRASAINFADVLCLNGLYPTMPRYPFVPGFEVAGVVAAVGAEVSGLAIGDAVIALTGERLGGHASHVNVPAANAIGKPDGLSFEDACGLPVVFSTVYYAFELAKLSSTEHVLVQSAAGGCGLMALQLAHERQAVAYGTSSRPEKLDLLRSIGVRHVIDYKAADIAHEIRRLTSNRGVDVVLNMLGGAAVQQGLDSLAPFGRYLEIAVHALKAGQKLDLSRLVQNQTFHSIDLRRAGLGGRLGQRALLDAMVSMLRSRRIVPIVSRVYPLHQIGDAFQHVSSGNHVGKVVVSHTAGAAIDRTADCVAALAAHKQWCDEAGASRRSLVPVGAGGGDDAPRRDGIAIVAMAGRFPRANDVEELWENIAQGRDGISEVPPERWPADRFYDPKRQTAGKSCSRWMGVVQDAEAFDPLFFNISPAEAAWMDPQQRMFLEECWHCLEDAAIRPSALSGARCGVFVGCGPSDYGRDSGRNGLHVHGLTGGASSILAARISYFLNLTGPCLAIETACSSSLVAIAQACDSLVAGNCDLALAGGVHLMFGPGLHVMTSDAGMLSEQGRCFAFDARANGFVPGEGVGVLLLKRLPDAKRAGDSIAGIIRGWGVNHDGRTNGITAPSVKSQAALEKEVYRRFAIDPGTITLVEAHGTGTALGDPIEIEALAEAFRAFTARIGYCAVGSIKSNIGHLMTAAGVAGVMKALLSLRHRMLPPTINFERPNPHLPLEGSPFFVNTRLQPWVADPKAPRRAAVSSFGFSGTNAHLVIEEAAIEEAAIEEAAFRKAAPAEEPCRDADRKAPDRHTLLFPLSAKSNAQLQRSASNLYAALENFADADLRDIAYTLQVGREPMEHRLVVLAGSRAALEQLLDAYAHDRSSTALLTGHVQDARDAAAVEASATDGALSGATADEAEWRRIATSWLEGAFIDWDRLYAGEKPRRVRLPGYPFAHRRYAPPAAAGRIGADAAGQEPLAPLHPLVHRNTSDLDVALVARGSPTPGAAARASDGISLFRPRWIASAGAPTEPSASDPAIRRHLILCEVDAIDCAAIQERLGQADCTMLHATGLELPEKYEQFSLQVLDVLQRIQRARPDRSVLVQLVGGGRSELVLHGLGGMLRAAQLESAVVCGQVIDAGEHRSPADLLTILEAEARECQFNEVRYRNGTRSVAGWAPIESSVATIPWRAGGVYVISGGGGRLGVLMAEEIARRAQGTTIVLLGRRDPMPAHAEVRVRLESLGASVRYHQIDVADRAAVERVIHDTASDLGAIHGIVHAAGVLRDGYIYKKLPDDVRAVLAPKVGGIVNLDLASRSQPLDVFIAFSSFAGAMANAGQADYVAANAFMDAYARHRASLVEAGERHGRTLSVNWPLWRDGGMQVDAATERRMARDLGLVPLDSRAALDAMYRCLTAGDPQVLVLSGDAETIGRRLFGQGAEPGRHATTGTRAAVANAGQAPDGATRMKVERVLVQAVSGLLGIDAHEIDRDTELGELGCDSIAFAKLAGRLAEQYGIELAPIVFFEHRTINALAAFLLAEHGPVLTAYHAVGSDRGQNGVGVDSDPGLTPVLTPGLDRGASAVGRARRDAVREPVAVIGMSGCFPKAPNLRAFWDNLVAGRDCIDEIPANRWDWRDYHGGPGEGGNVTWTRHGAFIDGVDEFDALFFGISPAEAELMDPQQRLLMTHVWRAIEDAGYAPHSLAGSNTAIFAGTGSTGYSSLLDRANVAIKGYSSTGSVPSIGPNRMSFLLDWHGPSEPIETACSSSLVAVHRALQAIEQGACDAAVVGGVNTIVTPDAHIGFAKAGMLSASGRCKTFSDQADGYVRGEGVGMLFLKRLSLAERDGDHVYALLLGSAENHGGRANSLTAPNPGAQAALLEAAYDKAGIDPRTVGYIEAHGTGTPLGDPIEIDALTRAFAAPGGNTDGERVAAAQCGVGSVKTNIGHLELAAGIAGLIKVVLQLRHQTLVKSLHCDRLNPHIVLDDSPFFIVGRTMPWQAVGDADGKALPRRAGVSSFGFGGVNAHVVVEEYVDTRASGSSPSGAPSVIVLSARTERQLQQQAEQLLEALDREGYSDSDLADIAFTLQAGRDAMNERLGFVVRSLDELKASLARWLGGAGGIEGLYRGRANRGNDALSAFAVDEDLHGAIDAWFRKRKYDALLDLWTKGMEIDWRRVHADAPRRRLSLPTYPFARDRYWVPQGRDERGSAGSRGQTGEARYLHPLLHTNTSTLAEQQYTTAFTGDEPFLTDHRVRGHRILPGVAHLEIARAAFQMASGLEPGAPVGIRLLDVIWRRPLLVGARGLQVIVALDGEPEGRAGFRVYSRSQGPRTVEHLYSQGRADWLTGAPPLVDLAALRERCGTQALTAAQCYAAFTEAGIAYGAAHQGLASVRCGAGEVLGEIVLPSSMTARRAPYVLHPSLMDSALQAIIGLRAGSSNAALAIPSGLAVLEVFASCPDRLWSWVRPAEVAAAGGDVETYDVDLIGDDGLVCVRLRGLALRTLGAGVPASLPAAPAAASAVAGPAARVPVSGAESLASTVARILRREIANTLKVDERDIDEDTKLEEYGFDSITLTELANRLNHTYRLEVAPTVLFEYPTIAALAPYLAVEYAREFSASARAGRDASARPLEAESRAEPPPAETPAAIVHDAPRPRRRTAGRAAGTGEPNAARAEPVAVVGMSGRFPMAADLDAYWTNLVEGKDCIQEIPPSRWDWRACYGDPAREANRTNVKWGGFIDGVDEFDPLFFGIPPAEAEVMDPQQRLLMMYVWQALEDAAYAPGDLAGSRTGVFVGTGHTGYGTLIDRAGVAIRGYSSTGAVPSIGPNRISYFLNVRGPSEPIETACSSSLVALHRAMAALRTGECEMAIAGGVNTIVTPDSHIGFSKAGMLSPTGQCRAFSDGADGYVRGEGVGMLVLKPLSRAEADGDHIYGVLRGSAVGHNGRTSSLTAPSARAQAELVELAWLQAGVDPRTVTYIEAHGTGTPLGDPIEIDGLKAAFSALSARTGARDAMGGRCGLGSVKTNIGHLELAAGVAGVIKVLLQLKHGTLVATRHSDRLNPYIDLDGTPFFLVRETQPWKVLVDDRGMALPRRAGVSSFGFGGVNAHIVIEEHVGSASWRSSNSAPSGEQGREAHAIVLSARNEARLRERAEQLLNALERGDRGSSDLAAVAYTLQVGRDAMEERLGFVVDTLDELRNSLRAYVSGRETTGHLHRGQVKRHKEIVSVIAADQAFQSTVRSWIDERKLATLLALWTKGLNVPWKALHGSLLPLRISLPGYPFARDKYWVPAPQLAAPRLPASSPVPLPAGASEASPALMYRPRLRERSIGDPEPAIALDDHVVLLCGVRGVSAQLVESEITGARCRLVPVEDADAAQVFLDVSTTAFEETSRLAATDAGRRVLVQVVASADPAHGCLRGLGGLARSARLDHHHLFVQSIEIGGSATPGDVLDVVRQARRDVSTPQFTWTDGRWLQRDWEEIARDGAAAPPWKNGGVYLITGGAGRIGRCFARDIAARGVDATIVLAGRSAIHEDWTVALNLPSGSLARVEYRAVDVTQRGECAALVRSILQHHGRLDGIVHAAGVVRDRLLSDKSTAEWREVLAPKVAGLVNLDEAARDVPLDFFVACSSLSGAVGNRGQSDYSTANAFVDAYMAHRRALAAGGARRGTSLSILWPLWRDGGMRVDQETEARMWSGAGLVPLETAAGLEAFYYGVASGAGHLLVASGDRERISTFLRGAAPPPAAAATPAVVTPAVATPMIATPSIATPPTPPSDEILIASLRQELRAAISSLLKVDAGAVDGDDEWNEYGFDSITLTELTNRLNQAYGLELVPVVLFEHPTLNALARHLVHTCRDRVARQEASPRTPPAPMRPVVAARQGETRTAPVPVAVIGISGCFPMAPDLDAFWDNLVNGRDCISEVPSSRWDWREWYGDPRTEPNKTRIKWGGFIDGIDEFDPLFFGISPAEAEVMDPQQRLLMTHVWQAIEDAGYAPQSLSGTRTGIFVGTGNTGYGALVERAQAGVQGYSSTGAVPSIGPNRVSYLLNLRGPSEPIETACSSSLVALHHAVQAFENGTCDAAIAGGVNTIPVPGGHVGFEKAGMLSGDGTCRPFSDRANGYVRGEGVGMLFLKRLADAEAANDHIYGVIRASAENHGGRASSLTAPNPAAQTELIVGAYSRAGIDPRTVGYIEAHGTGTTLGDPVEIRGLARAFAELYAATGGGDVRAKHCGLGSVKSNVGHLELAAGVAGVLKVLLQLKHGKLVRTLHCETLNPYLQLDGTPFTIVRELQDWAPIVDPDGRPLPRRAGVSSFGFGGVNAHVLIEEYLAASSRSTAARAEGPPPAVAIVLSARTPDRLLEQAARLLAAIRSGRVGQDDLVDVAYTLQVGRDAMDERLALVVNALDALEAKLRAFLDGRTNVVDLFRGQVRRGADGVREQRAISNSAGGAWREGDPRPMLALWIEGAQVDWDRLYTGPRPRRRSLPTYPFARNRYWVSPRGAESGKRTAESGSRRAEPRERTADRGSRIAGIEDVVRESVATALRIEERDIQDDRSFAEYGVDSIVAANVIDAINDRCGSALNTIVLFDYNTVSTLSEHIAVSHPEVVARLHEQGYDDERGVTGQPDPIASPGHGAREAATGCAPKHAVAPRAPADSPGEPIAVVGFSGRYAGSATLDELWHHLVEGHDLVGDVTRWDLARHYAQALGSADRGCLQGSFIDGIDRFDADFFRISALEARYMDPQQRLFLEEAWTALEEAGYAGDTPYHERCGVFVGCAVGDYERLFVNEPPPQAFWGNAGSVIPARIAYFLNLHGPAVAVDTACSSSLVAIHLASQSLWRREIDMALAGGVHVQSTPRFYVLSSRGGMLSPTGRCRTFGDEADGFVPGEGVGVVVLKRLADALADGDHVYGVIRGSGMNQDGATNGITAPSSNAQERLLCTVYERYGIDPDAIQMVEAHGTGTKLGDPIELEALTRAFRRFTTRRGYCALGSIKANLGHTATAAGVTGVIKALLSIRHRTIPASLHCETANRRFDIGDSPFFLNTRSRAWDVAPEERRCAAVSSFGFSGTNAHLVIEEPPAAPERIRRRSPAWLVALAARTADELRRQAERLRDCVARAPEAGTRLDCADISYTLLLGRRHLGHRLACVVRDERELVAVLTKWLVHGAASHVYVSTVGDTNRREQPELVRFGNRCLRECAEGADETQYHEKLAAAAELYVQGHTLDFAALFAGGSYRKLSLPTYPFTRESYWVQSSVPPSAVSPGAGAGVALRAAVERKRAAGAPLAHPALHRIPSDSSDACYVATFTGDESFLRDHVVDGRRVLPAAAYLEMASAAAADALGSGQLASVRLWNTVWSRPIVVGREATQVHVRLRPAPEERDGASYDVFTHADGGNAQEVLHCQGRARILTRSDTDGELQPAARDIAALRATCSQLTVGKDELYSRFGQLGIQYGPAHRAVDTVSAGDGQALAELSLPPEVALDAATGWLHPSLVDGALQTVLCLMMQSGEVTPALPFALEELRVYRPCSSRMFVCTRSCNDSPASRDAGVQRFDIDLCDESGTLTATLRGFSIRRAGGAAKGTPMPRTPAPPARQDTTRAAEPVMLVPVWDATTVERIAPSPSSADRVVVIGAGERLLDHLRRRYATLAPMTVGSTETIDDIAGALTRVGPIDHLVWIAPETWRRIPAGAGIVAGQQAGVLQLFRVVKALIGLGLDRSPLGVTVVTYRSQSIHPRDPIDPTHAGVHGLVGSMAKECDAWKVRLLDLPSSDAWFDEDIATLPFDAKGNALACRERQWYRQAVIPVDARSMQGDAPSRYRRGGTYVVIGGAGGIGEAWTEYVVRRYQAQVVWIGRRPLNAAIEAKIAALAAPGPAPLYISADATDRSALQQAYDEIKRRFGAVHGVVHSALVLMDQALANLTEAQFAATLAAKVDTSVNAAEVFEAAPLDFFLCFSSLNSFSKGLWQSNYAAACVFKDAYARHLVQTRNIGARVMNWGYWGTVGIVASDLYRRRMARHGIGSIDVPEGMDALETLLSGPLDQVCFVKAFRMLPGVEYSERMMCHPSRGGSPRTEAFAARMSSGAADRSRAARELVSSVGGVSILDRLLTDLLFAQLRRIGLDAGGLSPDDVQQRCGIAPRYRNWLRESLAILARQQYLSVDDGRYSVARHDVPPLEALWDGWARQKEAWASSPLESTMMLLAEPAMAALHDVVRDLRPATEVLFPRGSIQLVERLYKHNPVTAYFSGALADCVVACLLAHTEQAPLSKIRILEIGAGTGAATVAILEKLRPYQDSIAEYCFTDLSQAFLINARKAYGSWNPFLRYAIVNIEQPLAQKVELGSYDVVVASNVLHATANVRQSLRHAKGALKRDGALVLNELTMVPLFSHLTFGLLDGWWRYEDGPIRAPGGPVVAPESWKHIVESEGFRGVSFPAETAHELGQQIIVAESDGVSRQPSNSQLSTSNSQLPTPNPQLSTPNSQLPTSNSQLPTSNSQSPTPNLQLSTSNSQLPTPNSQLSTPKPMPEAAVRARVQAVITGCLADTLQIDLDKVHHERFADYGIDSILAVKLMTAISQQLGLILETTLLVEHDTIGSLTDHLSGTYASELSAASAPAPVVAHVSVEGPSPYYRVVLERPGTVDGITLIQEESRRLAAHELRVAVKAFSLNFGDLLCVRGLYPTMPPYPFTPGFEASGVVVEVGTAVTTVAPGDAVIVGTGDTLGGHASMIICSEEQVFPKPRSLGFEEASTLPAVSITMIEAFRRAQVQRGERILIQTATGGTGLIAVQMAKRQGAEIFATAGSPHKLEYLERLGVPHRINYLASDFEADVMRLTRGEGVDVVINTLPGNALQKGLRCLRSGGRYVEIAMTALKGARAIDLSVLNDNQAFHSIDLRKLARANPGLMKAHRDELVRLVDAGCLRATIHRTVPIDRVKEAYACLENRAHIGKIAVTIPDSHAYRHVRTPVAAAAARPFVQEPIAVGPAAAPGATAPRSPELVRLNGSRDGRPVFWFHGALGGVEIYQPLAQEIRRPFFGLQARGWMSERAPLVGVRAMAEHYTDVVRSVQQEGSYDLGGYSLGGVIAYEVARQLQAAGQRVASIVMLDAPDSTHLDMFTFTPRTAMLQAVNTALFSTIASQPERLAEVLVHRDETFPSPGDEAFFEHLVSLAEQRGVFRDRDQLRLSVRQAVTLHAAYEVEKFRVDPLARPHEVAAYYFRNRSRRFWGTLESYLTMTSDEVSLDRANYWGEWERQLPTLRIVDVESSSHLTLLLEPASFATIARCCADLYAGRAPEAESGLRAALRGPGVRHD